MRRATELAVLAGLACPLVLCGAVQAQVTWSFERPGLFTAPYADQFGLFRSNANGASPDGHYLFGQSTVSSVQYGGGATDTWINSNGTTTRLTGLGGVEHEPDGPTGIRFHSVAAVNNRGHAIGESQRRWGSGNRGVDVWFFNGSTYTQMGFSTGPLFVTPALFRQSSLRSINSHDQVTGISNQYNAAGNSIGTVAWFYENGVTTRLGLEGPEYQNWLGVAGAENGNVEDGGNGTVDDLGRVFGGSGRYVAGGPRGSDLWMFKNGVTVRLNPVAPESGFTSADGERAASITITTHPTMVAGTAQVYEAGTNTIQGTKAWVYANGQTTWIDPPAPENINEFGSFNGAPKLLGTQGQVVVQHGWVGVPGAVGNEIWHYHNGVTTRLGVFNPTGRRNVTALAINADGQVLGSSSVFSGSQITGSDAWLFSPDGSGGGTSVSIKPPGSLSASAVMLGRANQAVLTVKTSATALSDVVLFQDGTYTRIDLSTQPGYFRPSDGTRVSNVTTTNRNGYVLGFTRRYDASGQSLYSQPWVWDIQTQTTTPIDLPPPPPGRDGDWHLGLGIDGSVSGEYAEYDSGIFSRYRHFVWSRDVGFVDIENTAGGARLAELGINYLYQRASSQIYPEPNITMAFGNAIGVRPSESPSYVFRLVTPSRCGPADIAKQGAVPGFDGTLDNNDFIVFINEFFVANALADHGSAGGVSRADGLFDNNDFIAFINEFFTGCP